jgi:hypothetical protein
VSIFDPFDSSWKPKRYDPEPPEKPSRRLEPWEIEVWAYTVIIAIIILALIISH